MCNEPHVDCGQPMGDLLITAARLLWCDVRFRAVSHSHLQIQGLSSRGTFPQFQQSDKTHNNIHVGPWCFARRLVMAVCALHARSVVLLLPLVPFPARAQVPVDRLPNDDLSSFSRLTPWKPHLMGTLTRQYLHQSNFGSNAGNVIPRVRLVRELPWISLRIFRYSDRPLHPSLLNGVLPLVPSASFVSS